MNGTDLLTEFRERRSEEAFRQLVLRYTNLVYAVAKRRVSNASLAEEITQLVFIRLAKAAPKLPGDAALAAWLHRTTVHASIDLWRSEIRRRNRENYAVAMQTDPNETVPWNDLAPVLDDAVNELADTDRQAIVLRFFADKSMREVGATLGVSEDAAKMRVSRALDRLRNLVGARGVSCGALGLAALLAQHSVEAAPAQVAANLAALKLPVPATAGLSTVTIVGVASLILVGAGFWFFHQQNPTSSSAQTPADIARADVTAPQTNVQDPVDIGSGGGDPDPLQLLRAVARARERITSGKLEFYGFTENTYSGYRRETNHLRLAAVFDGPKLRFESFGREYRHVFMGEKAREAEAKMKELGLTQEAAVQAGLLQPFESHHVIIHDGSVAMDYWEADKKPHSASIKDPTNGVSSTHFDPRLLGITSWLRPLGSVERYLGYQDAKSVELIGKELVEGKLAWHINLRSKFGEPWDFWLDVDQPIQVLKHAHGSDVVYSKYNGRSPIPTEVIIKQPKSGWHITQTNSQLNIPIDPGSFTLAGLGMQIGAWVSDYRNSRSIGYWTGNGLSEDLPKKGAKVPEGPKLTELMALLDQDPTAHFAMEAATWILLNTPDGPEVEKAAEVILQEHIQSPELLELCKEQDRVRHRSSKKLLQTLLEKNPNPEIKAWAGYNLGILAKEQAKHGVNKQAKAEAEKLFDRVIREHPKTTPAHRANIEVSELRRMAIGNPAPDIVGVDIDGQPMRLSDYRGKVVMVYFWGHQYSESEEHEKLLAAMAGKPFALIGVNSDHTPAKAKAIVEKHQIAWPSFWDGKYWEGPIHQDWHVRKWPSVYILDQNGVIRYRDPRWFHELEKAVNSLLP